MPKNKERRHLELLRVNHQKQFLRVLKRSTSLESTTASKDNLGLEDNDHEAAEVHRRQRRTYLHQ